MKLKQIILVFFFIVLAITGNAQNNIVKGTGIIYTNGAPTVVINPDYHSEWAVDTTNQKTIYLYDRDAGAWIKAGYFIQQTLVVGVPTHTPHDAQSVIAINEGDSLFYYRGGSWRLISGGGSGADTQDLSITAGKGTINLVDGGSVELGDSSSTNEIQTIDTFFRSNDTLFNSLSSDGQAAKFVVIQDNDKTNEGLVTFAISANEGTLNSNTLGNNPEIFGFRGILVGTDSSGYNILTATEVDGSVSNEGVVTVNRESDSTVYRITTNSSGSETLWLKEGNNISFSSPSSGTGTDTLIISSTAGGGDISQNGNSFSAPIVIGSTDNYGFKFITNNVNRMRLDTSGNLIFANTNSTSIGNVGITAGAAGYGIISPAGLLIQSTSTSASGVLIVSSADNTTGAVAGSFGNLNYTNTSGDKRNWTITSGFLPTSGTGTYTHMRYAGTVNQTGGANGITSAIEIDPTLTSAADYRALHIKNNSGHAIYLSGASATSIYAAGEVQFDKQIRVKEIAAPGTPATGYVFIYPKSDGKLYIKDDAGTETDLTATGGSSNLSYDAANHEVDITGGGTSATIPLADDDGATEGLASFTAADFTADANGNITIDYTNGQASSAGTKGFLTSSDYQSFSNKQAAIQWKDEYTNKGSAGGLVNINFIGSGVTAVDSSNFLNVTITAGAYTDEQAQDAVGNNFNASLSYDDATPRLYITPRDYGDITATDSGRTWTIDAAQVTYAKIQDVATDKLLGRDAAGTGSVTAIGVSGGIEFTGSDGIQTSAFTGDVTKTLGGTALTIADNSVDGTDIELGSDAQGDVMYYNGTNWARLAAGTSGQFLKTLGAGANPIWDTGAGADGNGIYTGNGTVLPGTYAHAGNWNGAPRTFFLGHWPNAPTINFAGNEKGFAMDTLGSVIVTANDSTNGLLTYLYLEPYDIYLRTQNTAATVYSGFHIENTVTTLRTTDGTDDTYLIANKDSLYLISDVTRILSPKIILSDNGGTGEGTNGQVWTSGGVGQGGSWQTPSGGIVNLSYDATNHEVDISGGGTSAILPLADDDGATEGLASFTATDFTVDANGNVVIDYANGQAATSGQDGFLQSADWTTFNNKLSSVTYTIVGSGDIPDLTFAQVLRTNDFGIGYSNGYPTLSTQKDRVIAWDDNALRIINGDSTTQTAMYTYYNNATITSHVGAVNNESDIYQDTTGFSLTVTDANNTATYGFVADSLYINGKKIRAIVDSFYLKIGSLPTAGQVLTGNAAGYATWQTPTGGGDINQNGNTFTAPIRIGTDDNYGLQFQTNGVGRVYIDSIGKVGIGTTTTSSLLTIQDGDVDLTFTTGVAGGYKVTDADVVHPFTGLTGVLATVTTNTAGIIGVNSSTAGGLFLAGFNETSSGAFVMQGHMNGASTTNASIRLDAYNTNGSTGRQAFAGTELTTKILDITNGGTGAIMMSVLCNGYVKNNSGTFAANGDAEAQLFNFRRAITGTAATELFTDGASIQALMPGTNSLWNVTIDLIAVCTAAGNGTTTAGEAFVAKRYCGISRIGTTTALIGSVETLGTDKSNTTMSTSATTITADNGTEALKITFTPPSTAGSTTTFRVVATVRLTQVQY